MCHENFTMFFFALKLARHSKQRYPPTRNYYENNSLIIIFRNLRRFCTLEIFGKEGLFQGITREIRNFSKISVLE